MSDKSGSTPSTPPSAESVIPAPDLKPLAASADSERAAIEALIAEIQAHAHDAAVRNQEIESGREFAKNARAELDGRLAAAKQLVDLLQSQVAAAQTNFDRISSLVVGSQAASKQASDAGAQAQVLLETARTQSVAVADAATKVESLRTQVEQTAGVIAAKSAHIEDGRKHADEVRAKIDTLFTQAQQSATNAEAQHQASHDAVTKLSELAAAAQGTRASIDSHAEAVIALRGQCERNMAATNQLAEKAVSIEASITASAAKLAELQAAADERLKTIESLLPGATSAGLASAFGQRRASFLRPQLMWQLTFVTSVLTLVVLAGLEFGIIPVGDRVLSYDKLGLSLLHRLPFALPIVWLALYSSRQAGLAKRLEEDYAFKETVSRSFEGYRRQMVEIEGKFAPGSPLGRFFGDTIAVITSPPGRTYEKHRTDVSPATALADSAEPIAKAAARLMPGGSADLSADAGTSLRAR